VLPGSWASNSAGETVRFWPKGRLLRNIFTEKRAVGFVVPGRVAEDGNSPSPLISIAIGTLPELASINGEYHLMVY
jgi:hypothetical protein